MNITKFDVTVLVVMGLAVVGISFVFPALGLSSTDTDESDIPELNVSENRFDLVGDAPRFPNSPNEGTLFFNTTKDAAFSENTVWLEGDTNGGYELSLIQDSSNQNTSEVILTKWNGSVEEQDRVFLNDSNPSGTISVQKYTLAVELTEQNAPPEYLEVSWRVSEGSESDGFIGTVFGAASEIASVVAWFVLIFIWFSTFIVEFGLNAVVIMFQASSYFIGLLMWLITTYGSVVSAAPSWTKVFVALPGIILSVTLGKILVIFIGLLPTT